MRCVGRLPAGQTTAFDAPLIVETVRDVRLEAGIELQLIHANAADFGKRHHPSRDVIRLSKGLSKTKLISFGASAVEAADPWTKLRLLGPGLQARPTKRSSRDPPDDWKGGRRRSKWGPGSATVPCAMMMTGGIRLYCSYTG